jgi:hypothetical protein
MALFALDAQSGGNQHPLCDQRDEAHSRDSNAIIDPAANFRSKDQNSA